MLDLMVITFLVIMIVFFACTILSLLFDGTCHDDASKPSLCQMIAGKIWAQQLAGSRKILGHTLQAIEFNFIASSDS